MVNIKLVDGKGYVDVDDPKNQDKMTGNKVEQLVNESNNVQSQVMARLEALPNIINQVEALKQKESFRDLGEALSLVTATLKPETTRPLSVQVQAIATKEKKEKKSLSDSLGGILGFMPGGNNDPPRPEPVKIYDPLICEYCGSKLKPQWTRCVNCGAAVKPHAQFTLPAWIKPHHMHFLDFLAGVFTFVVWGSISYGVVTSFGLTWVSLIGLSIFWIAFVVAWRVVTGGILD